MSGDGKKTDYWYTLTRPLVCEGCGRELWGKGFFRKLTQHGRPGPSCWAETGTYRGKPQKELVRTSVTVVPLDCSCGRAHSIRVLWVPRYPGSRKPSPMQGYQIWSSETEEQALDRALAARKITGRPPQDPGKSYNPMDERQAEQARNQIAAARERFGWK